MVAGTGDESGLVRPQGSQPNDVASVRKLPLISATCLSYIQPVPQVRTLDRSMNPCDSSVTQCPGVLDGKGRRT